MISSRPSLKENSLFSKPSKTKPVAIKTSALDDMEKLVPNSLDKFTEMYYQLTQKERELIASKLAKKNFSYDDAYRIIGHARNMVISERNIDIAVKDKNGLARTEDNSYIVENFPQSITEKCARIVKADPKKLDRYVREQLKEASQRATVKK